MEPISTPYAPKPLGHYSQAIQHAGLIFVSGQLPIDPETGEKRLGSIEEETEATLANIAAILRTAGSGPERILKTTVYITDLGMFSRFNTAYGKFFGEHKPARASVPVATLPGGAHIEIEAIAAAGD